MNEDQARELIIAIVGRAAMDVLERLIILVREENERQNLVARSTIGSVWNRHVLDSIQLLKWAGPRHGYWLDVGSGGGFPGLAVAAARPDGMILVEPRRRRADFLRHAAAELGLHNVSVLGQRVETLTSIDAAVISARAVAPAEALLGLAHHCSSPDTVWLLPRGENYEADLRAARLRWKGLFHVEQSLSDPSAGVLIATQIVTR